MASERAWLSKGDDTSRATNTGIDEMPRVGMQGSPGGSAETINAIRPRAPGGKPVGTSASPASGPCGPPALLLLLLLLPVAIVANVASAVDGVGSKPPARFENTIRPLLLTHCIPCHGPKKAESGLRLDSRESLLMGGDGGPAISLDEPPKSLVLQALRHSDGLQMPPEGKLAEHEIAAVEQWIRGGAVWPAGATLGDAGPVLRGGPITNEERSFWSLQAVSDPLPPPLRGDGVHNAVDRFVLRKLREAQLKPMPPAPRRAWIRRATLDLTGLPPTPDEVQAFVRDRSDDAYAKVVDRLLASTAYGERWGRHWLDVVRYADTAGETADYPTPLSYKYRNWVVDAFNADMPYDRFVRQQIAGDILALQLVQQAGGVEDGSLSEEVLRQYRELLTATGFIAISRRFGFDVENYHHLTIQDTIDVIGQSMLGLTLGCARCHDHKYDPVNMKDYYAWYGIFQSTRYSFPGSEQKKRPYDLFPAVPPSVVAQRQQAFEAGLATLNGEIEQREARLKQVAAEIEQLSGSADFFGFEQATIGQPPPKPYGSLGTATMTASAQSPFTNVFPQGTRGIAFPSDSENNAFGRTLADEFTPADTTLLYYNIDFRNTSVADGGRGAYRFYIGHGPGNSGAVEMAANANSFLVKDGQQYESVAGLKMGTWYNLQVTLDLQTRTYSGVIASADGAARFEGRAFTSGWDGVINYTFVDKYGPGGGATPAHEVDNLRIDTKPFRPAHWSLKIAGTAGERPSALADKLACQRQLRERLDQLVSRRDALKNAGPLPAEERIYGAIEQDQPAHARIQLRGEKTRLGDEVPRRNLEILGGDTLPEGAGSGRLQLAEWLTRDDNPLLARVMVNRIWQQHFGRGLVGTENDFGARGQRPSHPELLDWLASRFREAGYSVKSMHRLIMNSAAYQRSSQSCAAAAERDPEARLLWRFNRRRLSAEEIRDAMLLVSGSLDRRRGQAHPFPAVETWGFSQHNPYYGVYRSNRRSVYLMQQRLKRHPFLGLFDGADTNVSTARRELTTVPTQALFLMNNEFVHEQSAALAERLINSSDDDAERIELAFQIALARAPAEDDRNESVSFLAAYREAAVASEIAAAELEATTWAAFARSLLTRNEFLFVD